MPASGVGETAAQVAHGPAGFLFDETAERGGVGEAAARIGGVRCCFAGSADRACYVYSFPDLRHLGALSFDFPPWGEKTCRNGRVWPCLAELPEGFPFRHILLTMDRANFPGMSSPNWTYGGLVLYGAN